MRFILGLGAALGLLANAAIAAPAPQPANTRGLQHQARDISDAADASGIEARNPTHTQPAMTGLAKARSVDNSISDVRAVHQLEARDGRVGGSVELTTPPHHPMDLTMPAQTARPSAQKEDVWRKHRTKLMVGGGVAAVFASIGIFGYACSQGHAGCKKGPKNPGNTVSHTSTVLARAIKMDSIHLKARSPKQSAMMGLAVGADKSIPTTRAVHQLEARNGGAGAGVEMTASSQTPLHPADFSTAPQPADRRFQKEDIWRQHRTKLMVGGALAVTTALSTLGIIAYECHQGKVNGCKDVQKTNQPKTVHTGIQSRAIKSSGIQLKARDHVKVEDFDLKSLDFARTRGYRLKARSPAQ